MNTILFISCQPQPMLDALGFNDDRSWFARALGPDFNVRVVRAPHEPLPASVEEHGIIFGGSAHSVNDDLPWIGALKDFAREMREKRKPMLGDCFGHQLLATAFGGEVRKNPRGREFGFCSVNLKAEGRRSPLFEGVPERFWIAESHGEIITSLPDRECSVLAENAMSGCQAVRYDDRTFSTQFHPEITPVALWQIAERRALTLQEEGCICDGVRIADDDVMSALKHNLSFAAREREMMGPVILRNFGRIAVRAAEEAAVV